MGGCSIYQPVDKWTRTMICGKWLCSTRRTAQMAKFKRMVRTGEVSTEQPSLNYLIIAGTNPVPVLDATSTAPVAGSHRRHRQQVGR